MNSEYFNKYKLAKDTYIMNKAMINQTGGVSNGKYIILFNNDDITNKSIFTNSKNFTFLKNFVKMCKTSLVIKENSNIVHSLSVYQYSALLKNMTIRKYILDYVKQLRKKNSDENDMMNKKLDELVNGIPSKQTFNYEKNKNYNVFCQSILQNDFRGQYFKYNAYIIVEVGFVSNTLLDYQVYKNDIVLKNSEELKTINENLQKSNIEEDPSGIQSGGNTSQKKSSYSEPDYNSFFCMQYPVVCFCRIPIIGWIICIFGGFLYILVKLSEHL